MGQVNMMNEVRLVKLPVPNRSTFLGSHPLLTCYCVTAFSFVVPFVMENNLNPSSLPMTVYDACTFGWDHA